MGHVGEIWYYKEITQLYRRGLDYVWVETCFATNFLKPGKALAIEGNTPRALSHVIFTTILSAVLTFLILG